MLEEPGRVGSAVVQQVGQRGEVIRGAGATLDGFGHHHADLL